MPNTLPTLPALASPWTIETCAPNSHIIRVRDIKPGWDQWVMLASDRHHDNAQTRQDLEKEHLDLARERGAIVLDGGDLFCAMQGKYDPRANMSHVRPEHKTEDYLDALLKTADDFFSPYADLFALVARGNHETNIRNRHGTDLTSSFVDRLRQKGSRAVTGEYSGWVTFLFHLARGERVTASKQLHYFHGAGGGGPVTRGVIFSNRAAVNWPDADIVWSGHTHDEWVMAIKRERCTSAGRPYTDIAWHVRTPSYKDEHATGSGWAVEKGHNPKPLGCVWLHFYLSRANKSEVRVDAIADLE